MGEYKTRPVARSSYQRSKALKCGAQRGRLYLNYVWLSKWAAWKTEREWEWEWAHAALHIDDTASYVLPQMTFHCARDVTEEP